MGNITVPGLLSAKHPPAHVTHDVSRNNRSRINTAFHCGSAPASRTRPGDSVARATARVPPGRTIDVNSSALTPVGGVVVAVTELPSALRLAEDGALLLDLRPGYERADHPVEHALPVMQATWREALENVPRCWVILLGGTPQEREELLSSLPESCPVLVVVDT